MSATLDVSELPIEWKRRVIRALARELLAQADMHEGLSDFRVYDLVPKPRPYENIDDYRKRVAGLKHGNTREDGWDQGAVENFIREVADWILKSHPANR